jgi:hypothetical protein
MEDAWLRSNRAEWPGRKGVGGQRAGPLTQEGWEDARRGSQVSSGWDLAVLVGQVNVGWSLEGSLTECLH